MYLALIILIILVLVAILIPYLIFGIMALVGLLAIAHFTQDKPYIKYFVLGASVVGIFTLPWPTLIALTLVGAALIYDILKEVGE